MSPESAQQLADMLRALGHPLRLRIMALLCRGPLHVGALAERLETGQAVTSQQLRILRLSRLVGVARLGGQAVYRLADPHMCEMLGCLARSPWAVKEHR